VRGNHLNAFISKLRIEWIAVISDQGLRLRLDHVEIETQLHQRDLVIVRRMVLTASDRG
jgi:hypothetical protein